MRTALTRPAALGFRAHSGWAAMVVLGGAASEPVVLQRRRVQLVKPGIPVQPYHAAADMELQDAERFLRNCAGVARALAQSCVVEVLAELAAQGFEAIGSAVLLSSGRSAGDLASTLASHPAIHTAEGEFFRDALRRGSEASGLPAGGFKERNVWQQAARTIGVPPEELQRRIGNFGKAIGPPWTQDQKLATLAAWLLLMRPAQTNP